MLKNLKTRRTGKLSDSLRKEGLNFMDTVTIHEFTLTKKKNAYLINMKM